MRFATVNDVTIHYGVAGNPSKNTIVFANSLGTDFRIWQDVALDLVTDYRVVLYDKRGHGLSDVPVGPYTMDDQVSDLIALLDYLGIEQVIVCGVSVGGMLAQGLAARAPDRIQALVLCDTAHKIGTAQMWNDRIEAVLEGGLAAIADSVMDRWFSNQFLEHQLAQLHGYRNMFTRTSVEGYLATCAAIRDTDLSETTARIRFPTLCVCGEEDGATPPELVESLALLVQGSWYERIADAGHLPSVEQPQNLARHIRKFLAAHDVV